MNTVIVFFLASIALIKSQPTATRTYWEYQRGPSTFTLNPNPGKLNHGDISEYSVAVIPNASDPNWVACGAQDPFCTSGDNLGIHSVSRLPGCWTYLDFSYFQTFVTVPVGVTMTQFTIDFDSVIDDGARISIYNSAIQGVVPNGYCFLSQAASPNLVSYIVTGVNRIVITQVDDCAVGNNIIARVTLNGNFVQPVCNSDQCRAATWDSTQDRCVYTNHDDGTGCDDGNLCTTHDVCTSGLCGGSPVVCPSTCGGSTATCNLATGLCVAPTSNKKCYCDSSLVVDDD